jgi:hypothetical protein
MLPLLWAPCYRMQLPEYEKNWAPRKHPRGLETLELETVYIMSRKEDVGVQVNLDGL